MSPVPAQAGTFAAVRWHWQSYVSILVSSIADQFDKLWLLNFNVQPT